MERLSDNKSLPRADRLQAASPLWQIAPVRDAEGALLADFLLLIPRLEKRGAAFAEHAAQRIRAVCEGFGEQVVFAELNAATGSVWVSVQAQPGLCAQVARAIRAELPEVRLVGGQIESAGELVVQARWWQRLSRIRLRAWRRLLPCPPDSVAR